MNTDNILAALGNTGGGNTLQRAVEPSPSNALIGGGGMGTSPEMKALLEKLKRQSAFAGLAGLLASLGIVPGKGGLLGGGNGGGSGGGGGFCLRWDTPISLPDGSMKLAKDVRPGDLIMGIDHQIGNTPQEVFSVNIALQKCYRVAFDGGEIYASGTHNWYVSDGNELELVSTLGLVPGMLLIRQDATYAAVESITEDAISEVFWWNCAPNHCYYAGGVLHHNSGGGLQQVIKDDPVTGGLGQGMGKEELGFTIGVGGS